MSECKLCGKKGLFVSVNSFGLCSNCAPRVAIDVQQRVRIIIDCLRLISESKNLETRISRCDILIQHATALKQYEDKGISTLENNILPSKLIERYSNTKDTLILEALNDEFEQLVAKSEIIKSISTIINNASKILLKVNEMKKQLNNKDKLNEVEEKVKKFVHDKKVNSYLEAARKADFKGQKAKAIDQYKEALYFIKNDNIDDSLQANELAEVEKKIEELSK